MPLVASYQQGAFTTPVNGAALDAAPVLANDNTLRLKFNSHDADATIHVQSSVLASRPAAGTAGRFWVTSDGLRGYLDSGSSWGELAYLPYVAGATSAVATLNTTTGAATDNTQILFQRASAIKWRVGTNIGGTNNDRFDVYNEAGTATVFSLANSTGLASFSGAVQKSSGVTGSLASGVGFSIVAASSLVVDGVYFVTTSKIGSPASKAVGLYVVGAGTTSSVVVTGTSGNLTLITTNGDLEGQQSTGSSGTYQWSILRLA